MVFNGKYGSFDYLSITGFVRYPKYREIKAQSSEEMGFSLFYPQ